jgi:hypothetical protein
MHVSTGRKRWRERRLREESAWERVERSGFFRSTRLASLLTKTTMASLHSNPALHHSSSSHSPHHHPQPPSHLNEPSTSSSAFYSDGDTLAPTYSELQRQDHAGGGDGSGCLEDERIEDEGEIMQRRKEQDDAVQREVDRENGKNDDGMLHAPEVVERPGMSRASFFSPFPPLFHSLTSLPSSARSSSDRLRSVARALEAANILSLSSAEDWDTRPPGIDPRRVDIPDLKCRCVMQVADYSSEKIEFSVLTNKDGPEELEEFLKKGKPEFAKVLFVLSISSAPYPYPSPPLPPYPRMSSSFSQAYPSPRRSATSK